MFPFYGLLVACVTYSLTVKKETICYSETSVSRYTSLCPGCLRYLLLNPEDGGATLLRNVSESLWFLLMSRLLALLTPQPWRRRHYIAPKRQWAPMLPSYVQVACVTSKPWRRRHYITPKRQWVVCFLLMSRLLVLLGCRPPNMDEVVFSEISANFCRTIRYHTSEGSTLDFLLRDEQRSGSGMKPQL
jgi:hypothetical protein